MLSGITITGADDSVNPLDLVRLSNEFPFVEWGLLISQTRIGTARYPSAAWLYVSGSIAERHGIRLSAHLCGRVSRTVQDGNRLPVDQLTAPFSRIQLNGYHLPTLESNNALLRVMSAPPDFEWIIQARDQMSLCQAAFIAGAGALSKPPIRMAILDDASGGRGIRPKRWSDIPILPDGLLRAGRAGGINESNLAEEAQALAKSEYVGAWLDLESGARTNDEFDIAKVRRLLEIAASFIT